MAFLCAAGGRLEYRWTGPGPDQAPTLVFLHEALGCAAMWRDLPEALSARSGFGALNYSRQGHGRSAPAASPRGLDYLHREALEVLPEVLAVTGVRDAVLIGHSDGASIALIYAGQQPALLRGLVLEAPHVFVEPVTLSGIRRAGASYAATDLADRLRRYHGENTDEVFRAWYDTWLRPDFQNWNIEAMLADIVCATLVLQGRQDAYGTLDQVTAIARRVAGPVQTVVLDDCGHIPHREQRLATADAILQFLARRPAGISSLE